VRTLALLGLVLAVQPAAAQTLVAGTPAFTGIRDGRYFVVELKTPHRVVSTSAVTGGQSDTVKFLVNHQSMEAAGDIVRHDTIVRLSEEEYHAMVAKALDLRPSQMAMMGTAANINYMAHVTREFRDLRVDAFVTAGVEGNATRAGDPASWHETNGKVEYVPYHGTINTIVVINRPLTAGAEARVIMVMSEAKAAALTELAVPSRVTPTIATGTGTDQFIIAAPLDATMTPLRGSGSHTKIGELVGDAVRTATLEALRWQNGLERSYTRSITRALGRFGLTEEELQKRLQQALPPDSYDLLVKNTLTVTMEPRVSAAAYAYAAVLDRLQYGTLSSELSADMLRDQAATVAVSLSSKAARWNDFRTQIGAAENDRLAPFVQGLALGWRARWAD
jgi:adenosylcobinamide amidohydrolase